METPEPRVDRLLRTAIEQKRLIRFNYKGKPRIVEPHDYGIHKGSVKLFGYQATAKQKCGVVKVSVRPFPNGRGSVSLSEPRL